MNTEIIGSDEVAQMLRCTPVQVEVFVRDGELPALKFGRSWIFIKDDLIDFLADKARDEAEFRKAKKKPIKNPIPEQKRVMGRKSRVPPPLPIVQPQVKYQ